MRKIDTFDIALANFNYYQDNIKSLYPGEYLSLKKDANSLFVESYVGCVGKVFPDDAEEIIPYYEKQDKYYIEVFAKKFYTKQQIKLAVVVIVNVYEKDTNFVEPVREFLGDYTSEPKLWIFGEVMEDYSPKRMSVTKTEKYQDAIEELDEYDDIKFVIAGNRIDVFSPYGRKIGELSKKMSEFYIPLMRDPDKFLTVDLTSINENEEGICKCRVEVSVHEKRILVAEHREQKKEQELKRKKLQKEEDNGCLGILSFISIAILVAILIFNFS